jgi:hypothetical protein
METSASDDSSDVDIYLEELEEMVDIPPPPSQRITSPSMRSKAPKRTPTFASASIEKNGTTLTRDRSR